MNDRITALLDQHLNQHYSCYHLVVHYKNRLQFQYYNGSYDRENSDKKITKSALFDLASLTKPLVTAVLILKLIDDQRLAFDSTLEQFFDDLPEKDAQDITIQHLLTHSSGIKSWYPLYEKSHDFVENVHRIMALERKPMDSETIYSCLNYFLLEYIFYRITNAHTKDYFLEHFIKPMQLEGFVFAPVPSDRDFLVAASYAAEGGFNFGQTNDDNSRLMNLNCANAGLFADAAGLHRYLNLFHQDGLFNGTNYLSYDLVSKMKTNHNKPHLEPRGLGWDMNNPLKNNSSCGRYFSAQSYGHTGFTGTSIWIDPIEDIEVILLTNKSLYLENNKENQFFKLRQALHDLVYLEIKEGN